MEIQDQLRSDLGQALRDRDELRKTTIRMGLAAIKNAQVAKNADLTEEEVLAALSREVKQRRDAIIQYERGGRDDLVTQALAEIEVLQQYLPHPLTEDEIKTLARQAIDEAGVSGPKQMGQVMRVLMPRVRGRADGRMVSKIVKDLLGG